MAEWLAFRGWQIFTVVFTDTVENVMDTMAQQNPGVRYMLCGTSLTGVNHVVICRDDQIEHDPSKKDSGIIGPCDQGYVWVELLVPVG